MNQKVYFKNGAITAAHKVVPIYNKQINRFKAVMQKSPKRTIILMLLFATLNFIVMVYFVNSRPGLPLIPKGLERSFVKEQQNKEGASFSISNYIKISKLRDSLDYLIKKPVLTKADSLLFIKVCEEYSRLDPAFFQQVKQSLHKKK